MIPIQDAVPSGKVPVMTIALVVINAIWFALESIANLPSATVARSPFAHPSGVHFFVNVLFLWLFGDNVEARVGRWLFVLLYLASSAIGAYTAAAAAPAGLAIGIGATCATSGVLGAYFVLLPKARVLMLVPSPAVLTEAPAPFFLALWWVLQVATFVIAPRAQPALLWSLVAGFATGAALALIARRPVVWT